MGGVVAASVSSETERSRRKKRSVRLGVLLGASRGLVGATVEESDRAEEAGLVIGAGSAPSVRVQRHAIAALLMVLIDYAYGIRERERRGIVWRMNRSRNAAC